jgi:sugar/nucleoside kinase (ribokinase family)/catechol 2,3-dioxygenase-like lactoylglutathione lyase family enzyme
MTLHLPFADRAARSLDVIGLGECSMDEVWQLPAAPRWGDKARAERRDRLGGGQVASAMVAAARLGLRASYLGAVGDDSAGQEIIDGLNGEGVDASGVVVIGGGATRSALLIVDGRGERTVIEHIDRRVSLHPSALSAERIAQARVLHLDATDLPASIAAAKLARAAGVLVSLDIDGTRPGLDELLALTDICITARGLPEELTGEADFEGALRALAKSVPGLVGCTLGADGAAALDDGHLVFSPAFAVTEIVDTTACGDTFHAGFLGALLEGQPVSEALRFANACAAIKCRGSAAAAARPDPRSTRCSPGDEMTVRPLRAIPVLPTLDVKAAIAFYEQRLGFNAVYVENDGGGVERGGVEIHFWQTRDAGLPSVSSCRVEVQGIEALYAEYGAQGVVHENGALAAKPWGFREFAIRDGDGNLITFAEHDDATPAANRR